jgi:DnaJ-class molecular chaperone
LTEERAVYSYERELALSVDAVGERNECPDCFGHGFIMGLYACETCNGTGVAPDYDAMDDADSAYERAGDR